VHITIIFIVLIKPKNNLKGFRGRFYFCSFLYVGTLQLGSLLLCNKFEIMDPNWNCWTFLSAAS